MNTAPGHVPFVRSFRQVIVWPLQLSRTPHGHPDCPFWQLFETAMPGTAWQRADDPFVSDTYPFEERHYKEFVVFLPHVQRFLYGEAHGPASHASDDNPGDSARRIYRRSDVAGLRLVLRAGQSPVSLQVLRTELCFFDDVDVAFLVVEVAGTDLPLPQAQDIIYRFGRTYPTGWNEKNGQGVHNAFATEWLAADGRVLASSNAADRAHYLDFTRRHRAAPISAHWTFLLEPLGLEADASQATIRYRQIEYHRMPLMAYLAVDDPLALAQEDWVRLGLVATLHPDEPLPQGDPEVISFNHRYCFDRYWAGTAAGPNTRFLCSGRAFILVGQAEPYFLDGNRGMLAQFRHQYFILFLINHFHHAALLTFSDKLVDAIHDLDIHRPDSVRRFRERIRACFETFLRFTHRYWFHDLSERPHMQALNRLCADHLGNDTLYAEVKEELRDMSQYLDSDAARRTNRLFVRLNVVTVFSIIGTVTTGFLGMNLFALAEQPASERLAYFLASLAGVSVVLVLALVLSRQLSEMMDVLSNDRLSIRGRLRELLRRPPLDD